MNSSNIIFGKQTNMQTAPTPIVGAKLVAYDLDGKLKQKDEFGVVKEIGTPGPTGSQGIQGPLGPQGPGGVQGIQGPVGPVGPYGLTWSGLWSATASYEKNYVVGYASASWFSINPITGSASNQNPSIDNTTWQLLAAQGAQGEQGVQGPVGPQGPQGITGPAGLQDLYTFTSDIIVSLPTGKNFGRYVDGDVIPANGKTTAQVIEEAVVEPIQPTLSLTSSTVIEFNQTNISNELDFSYLINSLNSTVSSVSLDWRRNDTGSWTQLTSDFNLVSYTHVTTNATFDTDTFNYRYIVIDTVGGTNTITLDIPVNDYVEPTIELTVTGTNLQLPETDFKRERGNIESDIDCTITNNNTFINMSYYQLQYQENGGVWVNIGTTQSITSNNFTIPTTNHNFLGLIGADSIGYRIQVFDDYQGTDSDVATVELLNIVFYGGTASNVIDSNGVRALPKRVFVDTSPFTLNTLTDSKFVVAVPSYIELKEVIDLDAATMDIVDSFILNTFNVLDAGSISLSYNVYTMTNSVAYNKNHRFNISLKSAGFPNLFISEAGYVIPYNGSIYFITNRDDGTYTITTNNGTENATGGAGYYSAYFGDSGTSFTPYTITFTPFNGPVITYIYT